MAHLIIAGVIILGLILQWHNHDCKYQICMGVGGGETARATLDTSRIKFNNGVNDVKGYFMVRKS